MQEINLKEKDARPLRFDRDEGLLAFNLIALLLISTLLGGCDRTLTKLEQVGEQPKMSAIENPQVRPTYKPMTWPMPEAQPPGRQYANTLWQTGSRAFFRDQRASRVGDILKVNVSIS